jgi:hypothetical protein
MGFSIQIRSKGPLVIPADSGYEPPLPKYPETISLSPRDMAYVSAFMVAAGAVDKRVDSGKKRSECAKGQVPIHKFASNDGSVVTAKEAALIAKAMCRQDLFALEFLTAHFPNFDLANYQQLARPRAGRSLDRVQPGCGRKRWLYAQVKNARAPGPSRRLCPRGAN